MHGMACSGSVSAFPASLGPCFALSGTPAVIITTSAMPISEGHTDSFVIDSGVGNIYPPSNSDKLSK